MRTNIIEHSGTAGNKGEEDMFKDRVMIRDFIDGIETIRHYHEKREVICTHLKEWNDRDLGWLRSVFPPEYRRSCLSGTDFSPDYTCDLFMYMVRFFENSTGERTPVNFQIRKGWNRKYINIDIPEERELDVAFFELFQKCTSRNINKRYNDAIKLTEAPEYQIIKKEFIKYYKTPECDVEQENSFIKLVGSDIEWNEIFIKDKEKNMYNPKPIDTSNVQLSEDLLNLTEMIAENVHDLWAVGRISEGWKWGDVKDAEKKTTPLLVPYGELPESEKDYDRNSALETLKLIIKLGYTIRKADE